jgi:hypothetical protein
LDILSRYARAVTGFLSFLLDMEGLKTTI